MSKIYLNDSVDSVAIITEWSNKYHCYITTATRFDRGTSDVVDALVCIRDSEASTNHVDMLRRFEPQAYFCKSVTVSPMSPVYVFKANADMPHEMTVQSMFGRRGYICSCEWSSENVTLLDGQVLPEYIVESARQHLGI